MAPDSSLHWIVPGRRAVVRKSLTYAELTRAWIAELESHRDVLARWYSVETAAFEAGFPPLRQWLSTVFPQENGVAAARDNETTVNLPSVAYYVRLWKGSLRVLLEHKQHPQPLGTHIVHQKQIEIDHGGPVKLTLNDNGEVTNPDASFLMGDVVEFPLFKFIASCGKTEYGNKPRYDDVLRFNGDGSFLLNTSISTVDGESPPTSPPLHDNLVAMRFQMLLNGCIAAFYHLDEPVFALEALSKSVKKWVLKAKSGAHTVYCRGFIYAGSLGRPTANNMKKAPKHWAVRNNGWCVAKPKQDNLSQYLPTKSGLAGLADGFVVTPGSTCSPTTLFLSNFMTRKTDGYYGAGSVGSTMDPKKQEKRKKSKKKKAKGPAAIESDFDFSEPEEVGALVPKESEEEKRQELKDLIEAIKKVLALIQGEESYMRQALSEAEAWPEWEADVPASVRKLITRYVDTPKRLMDNVNRRLKRKRSDGELAALERFHALLASGAKDDFGGELNGLVGSEEWGAFASVHPKAGRFTRHVKAVNEIGCKGAGCRYKHAHADIQRLRSLLSQKLKRLEKMERSGKPLIGSRRQAVKDLSDDLTDVNVISYSGHEIAFVRLYSHDKLLESQELPRGGHMAAYHPLDGTPFFDQTCVPEGQFYLFESTGSLPWWPGEHSRKAFGAGPFRWGRIDGNNFAIRVQARGGSERVYFGRAEAGPRSKHLDGLIRLKDRAKPAASLANLHVQDPVAFRPILIEPLRGAGYDVKSATSRLMVNGLEIYAARAVPFPTLREVDDAFAMKHNVPALLEANRKAVEAYLESLRTKEFRDREAKLFEAIVNATPEGKEEKQARAEYFNALERKFTLPAKYLIAVGGYVPEFYAKDRAAAERARRAAK